MRIVRPGRAAPTGAAALRFDCPDGAQSMEMLKKIQAESVEKALEAYTGLTPEHPLFGRILDVCRTLAVAAKN